MNNNLPTIQPCLTLSNYSNINHHNHSSYNSVATFKNHYHRRNHLFLPLHHNSNIANFCETIEPPPPPPTIARITARVDAIVGMEGIEPHPKEKEMKVNHETLRQIRRWAALLDGVRMTTYHAGGESTGVTTTHDRDDEDEQALSFCGRMAMWIWYTFGRFRLAFFLGVCGWLGMIPGLGFLICAILSYLKVYRPMSRFIFEQADRTTLQRYARECLVSDLLIGLTYPFGPFVQLCFSSNLRMLEAAERRVERHAEQCAKAFAYSYHTPSITATPSVSATAVSYPLTRNVTRNLSATLSRRIIRASEGPSIPFAASSQTTQAITSSTAAVTGIVSPFPVPGLQAMANIPASTPIQIPGQKEQQHQPDFVEWFTALEGTWNGDETSTGGYYSNTWGSAQGFVVIVPLPPPGSHPRRNLSSEVVYQPYVCLPFAVTPATATAESENVIPEVKEKEVEEEEEEELGSKKPSVVPSVVPLPLSPVTAVTTPFPLPRLTQLHSHHSTITRNQDDWMTVIIEAVCPSSQDSERSQGLAPPPIRDRQNPIVVPT